MPVVAAQKIQSDGLPASHHLTGDEEGQNSFSTIRTAAFSCWREGLGLKRTKDIDRGRVSRSFASSSHQEQEQPTDPMQCTCDLLQNSACFSACS